MINNLWINSLFLFLAAFITTLFCLSYFIKYSHQLKLSQVIRSDGPISHQVKSVIPTGGGLVMMSVFIFWVCIGCDIADWRIQLVLFTTVWFSMIGLCDDGLKLFFNTSDGLAGRWKLLLMLIGSTLVTWVIHVSDPIELTKYLWISPIQEPIVYLGIYSFLFYIFLICGSSNAVNLTDGLDGLAIFPSILIFSVMGFMSVFLTEKHPQLMMVCFTFCGSALAFLWYNAHPAQVFMGDVGSLSIGALMAVVAILLHQELLFGIMACVFVVETLSVIIQVLSFKLTGKRVFLMAPIHHHFELTGLHESKITTRFWIVTLVLSWLVITCVLLGN